MADPRPRPDRHRAGNEPPEPHDWRPADAEDGTEARRLAGDHFQLRRPDGRVEDLDAVGFDRWRDRGGGEKR